MLLPDGAGAFNQNGSGGMKKLVITPLTVFMLDCAYAAYIPVTGVEVSPAQPLAGQNITLHVDGEAVLSCGVLKLVLMPAIGFSLFRLFNVMPEAYLPGIILLASPTATVTYIMAKEMQGDSDFAVAAISLNTLLSAVTYTIWLSIMG